MIDVRELRIGNYISDMDGNIGKVSSIDKDMVAKPEGYRVFFIPLHIDRPVNSDLEYLKGIAITEEILSKCGFVGGVMNYGFFEFYKSEGCVAYGINDEDIEKFILIDNGLVRHLHQLQNLFFDLTGEELEIHF